MLQPRHLLFGVIAAVSAAYTAYPPYNYYNPYGGGFVMQQGEPFAPIQAPAPTFETPSVSATLKPKENKHKVSLGELFHMATNPDAGTAKVATTGGGVAGLDANTMQRIFETTNPEAAMKQLKELAGSGGKEALAKTFHELLQLDQMVQSEEGKQKSPSSAKHQADHPENNHPSINAPAGDIHALQPQSSPVQQVQPVSTPAPVQQPQVQNAQPSLQAPPNVVQQETNNPPLTSQSAPPATLHTDTATGVLCFPHTPATKQYLTSANLLIPITTGPICYHIDELKRVGLIS